MLTRQLGSTARQKPLNLPRLAATVRWYLCSLGRRMLHRGSTVGTVKELQVGPLFSFAGWPNEKVPRRAPGVYTVWRRDEFI